MFMLFIVQNQQKWPYLKCIASEIENMKSNIRFYPTQYIYGCICDEHEMVHCLAFEFLWMSYFIRQTMLMLMIKSKYCQAHQFYKEQRNGKSRKERDSARVKERWSCKYDTACTPS